MCMTACHEKPETLLETGFRLDRTEVNVPAEGGTMMVGWTVENPVEGMSVGIEAGYPDWINGFDCSTDGEITFNVDATDQEDVRDSRIVVSYGEDTSSFRVVQAGLSGNSDEPDDAEIALEIIQSRPNSIIVSIESKEPITYFINIEEKAVWDTYGSDEDIFAKDMELFQWFADSWGISLEAFLSEEFGILKYVTPYHMFMYVQDETRGTQYLTPDTEYVVYAYGIDGSGNILTDLYSVETSTGNFMLDNSTTFELDVQINGVQCEIQISPSDNSQQYMAGVILYKDGMPERDAIVGDILRSTEDQLFMYWSHPENTSSWEDIVSGFCYTGHQELEGELGLADVPGIVYAYPVDSKGVMNADMTIKEFRTSDIDDSQNKITMELSALTSRTATLTVTTTNNDLYLVMFDEDNDDYRSLAGEELANAILYSETSENIYSGRGNTVATLKNMHRNEEYVLIAFGFEGGKVTSEPVVLRFTTPEPVVSDVTCVPRIVKYYDMQQAYDKYPNVFRNPYGESRPVGQLEVELGGNPSSFSYFLEFTENVQNLYDDDLITMLENHYNDLGPFSESDWVYMFYEYSYTIVAVARDAEGNYGEVYRSEPMLFSPDGCSPIDELVL